ncbi:MAG: nucleoside deaminase [Candidatus Promineifilaceae bacterium]|nr:nucleoside deaminase [Candidatus Promineifilaceae bacterium]
MPALIHWKELPLPWQAALEEAWSAYCAGSLPIGAAIVAADQIVARGRNRLHEKSAESPFISGRIAHAEINAIRALEQTRYKAPQCEIYTTLEPCPMCLGAIRINRFRRLHFAAYDINVDSQSLLDANEFMRREAPLVVQPFSDQVEILLMALLAETILRLQLPREMARFHLRGAACPLGIEFGQKLYASGELNELRERRMPAGAMFDQLMEKLG